MNTQEEGKCYFSYDIWHSMCYVKRKGPPDQCLFNWTHCVVSLSFLCSDTVSLKNINSWRIYYGNIFLLLWYVFCAYELFSANLIAFLTNNLHKQLYVKDSLCLEEAAIWEIAVCSICRKQREYFDKKDVPRL